MLNQAQDQQVSLCEALDRILNKGAVVVADVTISVANIDLSKPTSSADLSNHGPMIRGLERLYPRLI